MRAVSENNSKADSQPDIPANQRGLNEVEIAKKLLVIVIRIITRINIPASGRRLVRNEFIAGE